MRLLIADDETRIRELIKKYALFEGYQVSEARNGMEAVERFRQEPFDLVILDVMMPELDGFSTLVEIRKQSRTPVIMLSARGEEYDRIHGFQLGVDDYVVKPFSPKELMMRVGAILSRTAGPLPVEPAVQPIVPAHEVVRIQGLTVDFTGRTLEVDGRRTALSPKEYDLLFYLVRNRGVALTRDKLITEVWGYDFCGDDRTLDTHIKLLRKRLGPYSGCIVTLRGVGYRFEG
ncbi:MAG: response regulator transcription factor [Clostridiales bacterium]|nr:response regulator transcription factor [Clostridiales bacterium]